MAGTLNVSTVICVIHSQKALGFKKSFPVQTQDAMFLGRNPEQSAEKMWRRISSMPFQFVNIQRAMGNVHVKIPRLLCASFKSVAAVAAKQYQHGFSASHVRSSDTLKIDVEETYHASQCVPRTSKGPLRYEVFFSETCILRRIEMRTFRVAK